ncbi:MAG: 16S rRNA (cytosine(967)-C(5))-methyltransferase RsmB [Lachnospiraceae bacterium]|nr:16S rRNA (cytosine(967)-C(5))-methyltransferase RsmB [Lachnospiraceae bacterium]
MQGKINPREIVLDLLMEVNEKNTYSHVVLGAALKKFQYLSKEDRSFISKVFQGTLERQITIDAVINAYSKVSTTRMKPVIRNLLRLSVYQILYLEKIPDSAAVNEAVKLAVKRHFDSLRGFVNGVLRNISRNKEDLPIEDTLSLRYSMPEWLCEEFVEEYGEETTKKILQGFLERKPMYIHLNTSLQEKEAWMKALFEEGVKVREVEGLSDTLELQEYDYLEGLSTYQKGGFHIQDVSSQVADLVAYSLVSSGNVLDVCAAPGGKSIHLAIHGNGAYTIESRDVSPRKLAMMDAEIERLQLQHISTKVYDACQKDESKKGSVDLLLCDLPCSGIGIIGRKSDIKYRMNKESQMDLVKLQQDILANVVDDLKDQGILIYSTCTIHKAENEGNVNYIKETLGLTPVDLTRILPAWVMDYERNQETAKQGYVQLLPGIHPCDGFFISAFRK